MLTEIEMKKSLFELLFYMRKSVRHSKYLDNVKHPAKKVKENEEYQWLCKEMDKIEVERRKKSEVYKDEGDKNCATLLMKKIQQITSDRVYQGEKEKEFSEMVKWLT